MHLGRSEKKKETTSQDQPERLQRNAWMRTVLGARPVPARSDLLRTYDFNADLTAAQLKKLKKETDRKTLIFSNLGEFGDVLDKAEELRQRYTEYLESGKHKSGLLSKAEAITPESLIGMCQGLIGQCNQWLGHFDAEGKRVGEDNKEADAKRKAKMAACHRLIRTASLAMNRLRFEARKDDPALGAALAELERLQQLVQQQSDAGNSDLNTIEQCRTMDARILSEVCGSFQPSGGTSEVHLIKGPDGSVAYAFKTIEGESDQTGMAKGGAAAREVMMSRLCQSMQRAGMDFGWPNASMTTLKMGNGPPKQGVLVDGIHGTEVYNAESKAADLNKGVSQEEVDARKRQARKFLETVPAREIQKVGLCNLALAQYDIKFSNILFEETGDGPPVARPYDAGAAMPDANTFMEFAHVLGRQPGNALLIDSDEQLLPSATAPMNEGIRKAFLNIDTNALLETAREEMARLAALGLDPDALGVYSGVLTAMASIKGMQEILRDNPGIPFDQFLAAYQTDVIRPLIAKKLGDWENDVRNRFQALSQRYPGLLPAPDTLSPTDMATGFLLPEQQERLDRIQDSGGQALLQRYDLRPSLLSAKNTVEQLGKRIAPEDRSRYPALFPNG